ncbi:MAG: response regulator [Planctomycetota bacterium]|jgi:excisionase family DNA binding protein
MESGGPLTTGDVAAYCHVSHVTVFRWIKRGLLQAYSTPGGHYRIRANDLVTFLKNQGMPVPEALEQNGREVQSVLLVDDDPQVLDVLKAVLSREQGLELDVASGGYEACIKIGAKRPDLIIVDLFMPGFDGFAVMREVRANPETCGCKIMVLSGFGTEDNRGKAHEFGADLFVEKPINGPELVECVRGLLQG